MRFKGLILKFGFRSLESVCKEKKWRIPFIGELRSVPSSLEHRSFWVADLPERKEDRETHALLYNVDSNDLTLVNKNFMEHAVVIVEEKK